MGHCYAGATPKSSVTEYWDNGIIPLDELWRGGGCTNREPVEPSL